ncbi:hypothetical protein Tco_0268960 [Tanacetum coccineum]
MWERFSLRLQLSTSSPVCLQSGPVFQSNFDYFPQTSPSFPQQYPCCEDCGGPHETFQCQPVNENYYEPNFCYDSNSFGFDQVQPPQSPVIHQPPQETTVEMLQAREDLMESIETFLKKFNRISFRETPKVLMQAWDTFFEIKHACKEKQHQLEVIQELLNKLLNDVKIISEELAEFINSLSWNRPAIYYDDDKDYTIAIIPDLATEEPVNSLSMGDEHLDTIPATESDEVIKSSVENFVPIPSESKGIPNKMCDVPFFNNPTTLEASKDHSEIVVDFNDDSTSSDEDSPYGEDIDYVDASPPNADIVSSEVVEIVIPEVGGIDTDILLTIKDDILCEKLLNVYLLIANIEALKDNPTPSSDFVTKSSSTSLNLLLEETNTFDNSLTESETFYFDLEENSSGSPTSHADFSLPDYEAFYLDDDHVEEKSSEFADELAHIISPPEYDCFYFKSEADYGELTSIVDSGICKNVLPITNVNLPFEDDQSPLLAYVVWIFLAFLTYHVTPPYLLSCRNEDTIFDPGISLYHSFMPDVSHRSGTFMKFNVYPNHLNERLPEFLKPLVLAVLSFDHSSFKSSASFEKLNINETHERLVTEKPIERRKKIGVVFRDTPVVSTKKTPTLSLKLKGMEMLSDVAMLAANTRNAIKGSEEDDVVLISKDERSDSNKDKSIDLNKTDDEEETQGDEFVHMSDDYVPSDDETQDVNNEEHIRISEELFDYVNVEMKDVEPVDKGKGDEEMIDVEKKEKTDVPPSSSSRFVSSNCGGYSSLNNYFSIYSSTTIPPFIPLLTIPISQQSTPPPIPTTSTITMTEAPTSTSVNTDFESIFDIQLRVSDLEKEFKELKQVDLPTILRASIRSEVPPAVNEYLRSSLGDAL